MNPNPDLPPSPTYQQNPTEFHPLLFEICYRTDGQTKTDENNNAANSFSNFQAGTLLLTCMGKLFLAPSASDHLQPRNLLCQAAFSKLLQFPGNDVRALWMPESTGGMRPAANGLYGLNSKTPGSSALETTSRCFLELVANRSVI